MLTIATLCLSLLAGSALAERTVVPTPIGELELQTAGVERSRQDCTVGNLNTPSYIVGGWFTGGEGYKYLFNPFEQNCYCPLGFQLETVSMMLNFPDTATFPIVFTAYVDLEEAVWDGNCWIPGPELCVSDVYQIQIDEPGAYTITLPIVCDCAFMDFFYFLSFHFIDQFEAELITCDEPLPCTGYNDWGSGWADLFFYGFDTIGLPVITGDVICCDFPVDTEGNTWGGVKTLYK